MIRPIGTLFVAAICVLTTIATQRGQIDFAYELGRMIGGLVFPFVVAGLLAATMGLIWKPREGGFHKRLNWFALVLAVASLLGQMAILGQQGH